MEYQYITDVDANIIRYLSEDNFQNTFSLKMKVYYNIVRPMLPYHLRHLLQEMVRANIQYYDNFIYDDLLNILLQESSVAKRIEKLYPGNYQSALVLTHDVDNEEGFYFIPKVIELEEKYHFRSSWNIVPYKYPIKKDIIELIHQKGHEIGIHGYNHDGRLYFSKKIFDSRLPAINEAIEQYQAAGFRSPMVHRNLNWLQQLNIMYDSSCFDYDPFQPFPGGTGSIWPFKVGKVVELPYTVPQDHILFFILKEKDISIWKNKINWLNQNHGMILTLTHPDYLREGNYLELYEEMLAFLADLKNVWHCLPKEIARYFNEDVFVDKKLSSDNPKEA